MGKTVMGLRDEFCCGCERWKVDGSDKVACEEGTLRKRALKRADLATKSKHQHCNLSHWTTDALHSRRKMVDAARC